MMRKNTIISYLVIMTLLAAVSCSTLPENYEKPVSLAYTDTDDTRLGQDRRDEINAHPGQSEFFLLGNGLDAFLARAILAEKAERSIDAQYYLYHDDLIGRLFTDLLLKAANRGVRVRVLVDDMDFEDRNLGPADHWGKADVIYDQPEKIQHDFDQTQYHLAPKLRPYFEGVTQELIIFSPYFVPGKSGTTFLRKPCERRVRVRIITNSLASNDVAIVHSGYSKYRKDMLRAGVELYEMNKKLTREQRRKRKRMGGSGRASLHAKSVVFDRQHVFIGSLNLDPRAIHHNTEIGVVVASREVANELAERFDQNIEKDAFRLELKKERDGVTGSCGTVGSKENKRYLMLNRIPPFGSVYGSTL